MVDKLNSNLNKALGIPEEKAIPGPVPFDPIEGAQIESEAEDPSVTPTAGDDGEVPADDPQVSKWLKDLKELVESR